MRKIGEVYRIQGKHEEALKYFRDALEMDRECFPENHPNIAAGLYNIGDIFGKLGHPDRALEHLNSSLEISRKISLEEWPRKEVDTGACLGAIGATLVWCIRRNASMKKH